ncbi:MAG: MFS transporter, partial [Clostridia bacterium]|nr:MFS transporter [Clostridia bacterium]
KLDKARVFKVGIAFVIIMLFWEVYDFAVPILLDRTYGLSATWRGVIMGLDNILAIVLLPLFGSISDKSKGKVFGRRTPFIVIGTLLAGILVMLLIAIENAEFNKLVDMGVKNIDQLVSKGFLDSKYLDPIYQNINAESPLFEQFSIDFHAAQVKMAITNTIANPTSLVLFIIVLFVLLVTMSAFRAPVVALMPDVTIKPLRSGANAIMNFMGGIGGFISIGLYSLFAPDYGSFVLLFLLLVMFMYMLLAGYMLLVNEKKFVSLRYEEEKRWNVIDEEEVLGEEKLSKGKLISLLLILASIFFWFMGYNAVRSHLSVYVTDKLLMESSGVGLINFANGLGGALALIPVGFMSGKIGRKKSTLIGFALASIAFFPCLFVTSKTSYIVGICFVLAGIGLIIVNVNTLPMVCEMSKGSNVGKYTGYYYVASMSAQAVAPFFAGLFMDKLGDNVMFVFASISILIAFIVMLFVKHGDNKPTKEEIKSNIMD